MMTSSTFQTTLDAKDLKKSMIIKGVAHVHGSSSYLCHLIRFHSRCAESKQAWQLNVAETFQQMHFWLMTQCCTQTCT